LPETELASAVSQCQAYRPKLLSVRRVPLPCSNHRCTKCENHAGQRNAYQQRPQAESETEAEAESVAAFVHPVILADDV
jgi:hypothetical protein